MKIHDNICFIIYDVLHEHVGKYICVHGDAMFNLKKWLIKDIQPVYIAVLVYTRVTVKHDQQRLRCDCETIIEKDDGSVCYLTVYNV